MIKNCFELPFHPTRFFVRLPKYPSETCHLLNVAKTMRSSAIFVPALRYHSAAHFHAVRWCSRNAVESYSRGIWFETLPRRTGYPG
jgi:hypothetical protein